MSSKSSVLFNPIGFSLSLVELLEFNSGLNLCRIVSTIQKTMEGGISTKLKS